MARLGEICEIISGSTPKTNIEEYWDGNLKWITPAELNKDSFYIHESERHITELAVKKTNLSLLPKGTVILSSRAPIGKTAITDCEMYCNQGFKNLICSDAIFNEYLYFFLSGRTEHLNALGRGATFKEISKSIVENIEIPLPPMDEQKQIVEQLKKVAVLISLRKQQLAKLDELVKSRFIEMFGDPVTNPMGWPAVPLSELAEIVSGITKGRKTKSTQLYEVPYMAVSNVKSGYIDWTTIKTIEATKEEIEHYQLMPFDLLMTEGGDPDKLGRGAIISHPPVNCIHQNHIFRVRVDTTRLLPKYIEEFLQHQKSKEYFSRCAKQTTGIASINMKQLRFLPVLLPNINLQNQFAAFVTHVEKSKSEIQKSLETLETLKKALMQQYFG